MSSPVSAVVIGAGLRGRSTYGALALTHPDRLRVVAVAEPDPGRRAAMAAEHAIPEEARFEDWKALLERPRLAQAAVVATGDTLHVEPALAAIASGYHVLLEKPIAPDPVDCVRVVEAAERAGRMLQIGHVLRHSPFYERAHGILAGGGIGELVHLELKEHVAHWHMTHSFVRGRFRSRELAAPLLLAKSCHDLDLMLWLVGRTPTRVSSTGGLLHYRPENAPPGAPARCTDDCPVRESCPHDAVRFYAEPGVELAGVWPWSDVSPDPSREARLDALASGPYGRCVYRCDNDAVDHQGVTVEFEGGPTAHFAVHGHGWRERRTLCATGTRGELRGVLEDAVIEVTRHGSLRTERHAIPGSPIGHFGGDESLTLAFADAVAREDPERVRASGRVSLDSHLLGFAAERARSSGRAVELADYRRDVVRAATAAS